ncbi:MAG: type I-E CRISPR-associated protein Cse1/CasA, partial [Butyricicoccus pullicaecorum]|nr:type I-E CRISPR-associated protein Cse1/CasA [Butyricicoccus pullicaecorum]
YRKDWDREPKSVTVLDYSIPNGNNHIHFDHKRVSAAYTPGEALRMLLAAQIFCTAAAQGYPSNVNGAPPWFTLIQGQNLFETLVFGMLETDRIELPLDCPPVLWRNFNEVTPKQKVARTSWLFGMYFPARRIHLIPSEDGHSVLGVYFSQGMNYEVTDAWEDPHVTYRITQKGRFNWKPSDDETIWRNLTNLIDTTGKRAPQIVAQYEDLDTFDRPLSLTLYGVQTNQANYVKAQRHDLQIPKQLLGNETALRFITGYIAQVERLGKVLHKSLIHKEIAEESRLQARQRYYAFCERLLWKQFDAMVQSDFNYESSFHIAVSTLCQEAAKSADWILEQLTLRGKTMLQVMDNQQKILGKEIAAIKKEMKR